MAVSSLSLVNFFFLILCLGSAILLHFEATTSLCSYWPLTLFLFSFLTLLAFSLNYWVVPGGFAWRNYDHYKNPNNKLRGLMGWPILGTLPQMGSLAHRNLAVMASSLNAERLMSFSLGATPVIISSHPETAREILCGVSFSDRPIKQSARFLMFEQAIGFAPSGTYWRHLRKIVAGSMFSPRGVSSLDGLRQHVADEMVMKIEKDMEEKGEFEVRGILQKGSLSNILECVFGSSLRDDEKEELGNMVEEGYGLIAEFNWEDFFPLKFLDVKGVKRRCHKLTAKVSGLVGQIVKHRKNQNQNHHSENHNDLLTSLLCLPVEERLGDSDMVAILWEMIFRGTDTVAILLEWIMARMVLHQDIQFKVRQEIDTCVAEHGHVRDSDIPNLPYLQAIVKESLRLHPPGPLLSWARLTVNDVHVDKIFVPAGTTAMVNMWAITHDSTIWEDPSAFKPERFINEDVSIMGSDLRLAPFGAGRRVCPGRALALATVHLWLARLLHQFIWIPIPSKPVELSESLRLSLEKTNPLRCQVIRRR